MTELSFLIDLLLNHKLPKATRELITARIKDVEAKFTPQYQSVPRGTIQAASTQALMAKHIDAPVMPPIPVEQVAQTPETAAAMQSRNAAIANAISGKTEKGQTSPRKW